ncbi:MAG: ribonuclease III [Clostridia bacterium]|nr:ribonuclease III [Clostridia bacterium]
MSPANIHPLVLAYVGDAVFEVLVREKLASSGNSKTGELNRMALDFVTAKNQCRVCDKLSEYLTEAEQDIFRRAKNAKGNSGPRSVTVYEYRKATGLEAVFGYNHLMGNDLRNKELFNLIFDIKKEKDND